jgi:hypothetical protein
MKRFAFAVAGVLALSPLVGLASVSSPAAAAVTHTAYHAARTGPASPEINGSDQLCAFQLNGLVGCAQTYPLAGGDVGLCEPICGNFWEIPGPNNYGPITIPSAMTGQGTLCMQLHKADPNFPDDTNLLLEPCNGIASQQWYQLPAHDPGTYEFENGYEGTECLNAVYYDSVINVYKCSPNANNPDQEWAPNMNPPNPS